MNTETRSSQPALLSRMPWLLSLACAILGCQPAEPPKDDMAPPEQSAMQVGINLEGLSYWGTEVPFVNLMKMASPWLTQCEPRRDAYCVDGLFTAQGANAWNTKEQAKLDLDAQGYPRSLPDPTQSTTTRTNFSSVSTLVPTGLGPEHRAARFIVLYDGEGTLGYGRGAVRNATLSTPGRDVIDVVTDGVQSWFQLSILATDPSKRGRYLRNLRVIPDGGICSTDAALACAPGAGPSNCPAGGSCTSFEHAVPVPLLHPSFRKNLRPFRAVRFMALQNTNASLVETWGSRTEPERVTWVSEHGDGAPVEAIVEIGNQLRADLWVNMPTRADDDYVKQFANFVRDHLQQERSVYVEYSNEVWNGMFPAAAWAQARAAERWPEANDTPFGKQLQWYGLRAAQVCELWHQVFGRDTGRIKCVIGAQAANAWTARQALECPLAAAESGGIPCVHRGIASLAIAPYFGFYLGNPKYLSTLQAWVQEPGGGLDSLFGEVFNGGELDGGPSHGALAEAHEQMKQAASVARTHGIELVAYEGGQHLVGIREVVADKAITDLFVAANRDPRMGQAYLTHLADWRASGGGLYNFWNSVGPYTQWGSWGLLEHRDQTDSPKYHAVTGWADNRLGRGSEAQSRRDTTNRSEQASPE